MRGMILLTWEKSERKHDEEGIMSSTEVFERGILKLKSQSPSHPFWYSFQRPTEKARSACQIEVADMIDNFQVWFLNIWMKVDALHSIKFVCFLFLIFPGLSSKVSLLWYDKFLISIISRKSRSQMLFDDLYIWKMLLFQNFEFHINSKFWLTQNMGTDRNTY